MGVILPAGTDLELEYAGSVGELDIATGRANASWTLGELDGFNYYPNYSDELQVKLNGLEQTDGTDYTFTRADDRTKSTVVFGFVILDGDRVKFTLLPR